MHILFLTDNFPPESNAPASRTFEHASRWVQAGHDVTVITTAPNFPEGKVFPGYRNRLYQTETMDGIRVVRVKSYIAVNAGFLKRILDYLSFMAGGFLAGLFQRKPDVIVATSPQFFCAVSGWALSAVRRKPFVFELRDIWPASITAVGAMKKGTAIRLLERLEMFLYQRADSIICVTHSFKAELITRGVDPRKLHVILNGVDLTRYQPPETKPRELSSLYNLNEKFVVGYIGTLGMAHALQRVLEAAERLTDREDIVFLFVGGGAAKADLLASAKAKGLKNVQFLGRQPKELMPRFWALCSVSLVPLKNTNLFRTVIPSKIFESMGMGVPLIISVPEGEATQIVRNTKSGVVVAPESPEQLAEQIRQLADNSALVQQLSRNCQQAAPHYSRASLSEEMLSALTRTAFG